MRAVLLLTIVLGIGALFWLLRSPAPEPPAAVLPATTLLREEVTGAPENAASSGAPATAPDPARAEAIRLNEQALELLDAGDPAAAEPLLVAALLRAPDDAVLAKNLSRTRVRLGRQAQESGRADEALGWFRSAALAHDDDGAPAEWEASLLLRRGDRSAAKEFALAALERFPRSAALSRLCGEIAFLEGDLEGAVAAYEAALQHQDEPAPRARLAQLQEEQRAFAHFLTDATAHCDSRYDPDDSAISARAPELHAALEEAWQDVVGALGVTPPGRILVLWLSPERYRGAAPEWSGGLYDGRVRVLLHAETGVDAALRATLRHELTHAVLHSLGAVLPTWLHEGLAQRREGRDPERARRRLRSLGVTLEAAALDVDWTAWTDKQRLEQAYGLALSLVAWLEERHGASAVASLLLAARGGDFAGAWTRIFARPFAEMEAEHRAWLIAGG